MCVNDERAREGDGDGDGNVHPINHSGKSQRFTWVHSILVLFRLTETCVAPINVEIFEILKTS